MSRTTLSWSSQNWSPMPCWPTQAAGRPATPVVLYVALDPDWLFVLVWDCCPEQPAQHAHAGDDAESGRGLEIVRALSERWGTVALERGKLVWATLALTNQEAPASFLQSDTERHAGID